MVHITEVRCRSSGNYQVHYAGDIGATGWLEVAAKDELEAYQKATAVLKDRSMTARVVTVCATLLLLCAFSLIGYGCSQREKNLETCLKAGKSYVSEQQGYSCK